MTRLIDERELPQDLRTATDEELETICQELREELITTMSRSSGHFASSLGATELTTVLHAVFNTPHDKLIWDVGHQGYIHKMITGRREQLSTIRQSGGLSGFLRRDESEYDCFGAGHAGTSISAGVGMRIALQKAGSDQYVVPIIGDGSLTAGMAFEAMNHAGSADLKKLIVVLNDNEMSISPNVGALSWLFSRTVTGETTTAIRKQFKEWYRQGYIPDVVYKAIDRAEEAAQTYFSDASVLFGAFGFRYIGPVDGHNIHELRKALENAKLQDRPVVVHARTKKGKGFEAAENDPLKWHAVKPFDPEKGEFNRSSVPKKQTPAPSYTEVFSKTLVSLAKENPKIIGITAAMPTGTGLDRLAEELPDQCIDVGISEQHAVTCAAGMACEGYRPVVAIYSTFLQRAYDQIIHDVCIQGLPVVFAIDRAGAVGNDGETHQGLFDLSYLRSIPEMQILCPKDEGELRQMLYTAINHDGPIAVRYPRGAGIGGIDLSEPLTGIPVGKGEVLSVGSKVLMLTVGPTAHAAIDVANQIHDTYGFKPTVVNARSVKPLDQDLLTSLFNQHEIVCTIEDNAILGGFGSAVLELAAKENLLSNKKFITIGANDTFTPHGSQQEQYALHGYDKDGIMNELSAVLGLPRVTRLSA